MRILAYYGSTQALLKGRQKFPRIGRKRFYLCIILLAIFQKRMLHHAQENSRGKEGGPGLEELVYGDERQTYFFIYKRGFQKLADVPAHQAVDRPILDLATLGTRPLKV